MQCYAFWFRFAPINIHCVFISEMNDLLLLHYSTVTDLPSPWAEEDEEVKKNFLGS